MRRTDERVVRRCRRTRGCLRHSAAAGRRHAVGRLAVAGAWVGPLVAAGLYAYVLVAGPGAVQILPGHHPSGGTSPALPAPAPMLTSAPAGAVASGTGQSGTALASQDSPAVAPFADGALAHDGRRRGYLAAAAAYQRAAEAAGDPRLAARAAELVRLATR